MEIDIPYGLEKITVAIPDENILDVITRQNSGHYEEEYEIIINSLKNPCASGTLSELAKGKKMLPS
jgi:nickel-dependent lactate racemase